MLALVISLFAILIIIVMRIAIAIMRSKKPLNHILAEVKYEVIFRFAGIRAIMDDYAMRENNRAELSLKTGRVAVITGGNRGIGGGVVKMLLQCDINVVVGCRNMAVMDQALSTFRKQGITTDNIQAYKLDLSSMNSVKGFARIVKSKYNKIHYLINNAGIVFCPYTESSDGYELHFATNYLGHFLLTHLLLPEIIAGGEAGCSARIINVSSTAEALGCIDFEDINCRKQYINSAAYSNSKLAQVLFTVHLNRILKNRLLPVQVHAVHPGVVNTDAFSGQFLKKLLPFVPKLFFKSPEQGAVSVIYACLSPNLEGEGGNYITNCTVLPTSQVANRADLQERLFEFTTALLGIEHFVIDKQS